MLQGCKVAIPFCHRARYGLSLSPAACQENGVSLEERLTNMPRLPVVETQLREGTRAATT